MRGALLRSLVGIVSVGAVVAAFTGVAGAASSTATAVSFTTSGTYTVPSGVTQIQVVANGAKGADSPADSFFKATGGSGSRVSATVDVMPGQVLHVDVGVGGGTSAFGGDGGGASDVSVAPYGLSNRVLVAAGGGGAGADSSQCGTPGAGGTGGGGNGADGPPQHDQCSPGGGGGKGATATAGGAGGDAFYVVVHHSGDGAFGVGGVASGDDPMDAVGGGGGGGWFGGGAGGGLFQAVAGSGGGGGGGSDHVATPAHDATIADGASTGAASVVITPLVAKSVSITTTYGHFDARTLLFLSAITHHAPAQVQHDATLFVVKIATPLVDRANQRGWHDEAHPWFEGFGRHGQLQVTSTYTTDEAASIAKVAAFFHVTPPTLQHLAVDFVGLLTVLHHR